MLKKIQLLQETSGLGLLFFNCVGQLKSNYRVYHKSVISPKRQVYNQAQGTFFIVFCVSLFFYRMTFLWMYFLIYCITVTVETCVYVERG